MCEESPLRTELSCNIFQASQSNRYLGGSSYFRTSAPTMLSFTTEVQSILQARSHRTSISSSAFKNDKDLVIGCFYGSYAYEYAKQNNIAFRLLDDVKLGDTDLNGVININDATMVQMDDVQLITLNDLEKKAADVNRDGEITIRDATLIQMYLANIITEF